MLIDLILAAIFVLLLTAIICYFFDGAFLESALIGIIILLIIVQKTETIRFVNTSPIISIIISALFISAIAIALSATIHKST